MSGRNQPLRHRTFPTLAAAFGLALAAPSCSDRKEEPPAEPGAGPAAGRPAPELQLAAPYSVAHWPDPAAPSTDEWETRYLEAASDADRIEIISEKQTSGPEFLAPLLRRALGSDSLPLNAQAIDSASVLTGQDAIDVLSGAARHESEEIAVLAAEAARELPYETRLVIFENNLSSPHERVRELSVVEFASLETKPSVDLLIRGLQDPAEGVVETTRKLLQRQFSQDFSSAAAAKRWWAEHQGEYNETLTHVVPPE